MTPTRIATTMIAMIAEPAAITTVLYSSTVIRLLETETMPPKAGAARTDIAEHGRDIDQNAHQQAAPTGFAAQSES